MDMATPAREEPSSSSDSSSSSSNSSDRPGLDLDFELAYSPSELVPDAVIINRDSISASRSAAPPERPSERPCQPSLASRL